MDRNNCCARAIVNIIDICAWQCMAWHGVACIGACACQHTAGRVLACTCTSLRLVRSFSLRWGSCSLPPSADGASVLSTHYIFARVARHASGDVKHGQGHTCPLEAAQHPIAGSSQPADYPPCDRCGNLLHAAVCATAHARVCTRAQPSMSRMDRIAT